MFDVGERLVLSLWDRAAFEAELGSPVQEGEGVVPMTLSHNVDDARPGARGPRPRPGCRGARCGGRRRGSGAGSPATSPTRTASAGRSPGTRVRSACGSCPAPTSTPVRDPAARRAGRRAAGAPHRAAPAPAVARGRPRAVRRDERRPRGDAALPVGARPGRVRRGARPAPRRGGGAGLGALGGRTGRHRRAGRVHRARACHGIRCRSCRASRWAGGWPGPRGDTASPPRPRARRFGWASTSSGSTRSCRSRRWATPGRGRSWNGSAWRTTPPTTSTTPRSPVGDPLRRHVLYRLGRARDGVTPSAASARGSELCS